MPFSGLRVLSLESRRAADMQTLILREGGVPFVAPSVKEEAVDGGGVATEFVEQLERGEFDMVICMTGVGLAVLRDTCASLMPLERLSAALRSATIVSRGPKPLGVLRPLGVPVDIVVPEPNTWREIVAAVAERPERRIAVQEYGRLNTVAAHGAGGARCDCDSRRVVPVGAAGRSAAAEGGDLTDRGGRLRCSAVHFVSAARASACDREAMGLEA